MELRTVISAALASLSTRARGGYTGDVIGGSQRWSGADLRGKAKRFGGSYARQRVRASRALAAAGGCIVAVDHGRLVTAVRAGMDDFGNAIYRTTEGLAITRGKHARIVCR